MILLPVHEASGVGKSRACNKHILVRLERHRGVLAVCE